MLSSKLFVFQFSSTCFCNNCGLFQKYYFTGVTHDQEGWVFFSPTLGDGKSWRFCFLTRKKKWAAFSFAYSFEILSFDSVQTFMSLTTFRMNCANGPLENGGSVEIKHWIHLTKGSEQHRGQGIDKTRTTADGCSSSVYYLIVLCLFNVTTEESHVVGVYCSLNNNAAFRWTRGIIGLPVGQHWGILAVM